MKVDDFLELYDGSRDAFLGFFIVWDLLLLFSEANLVFESL